MDTDGKFWFGCWALLAGVICVITICITSYSVFNTDRTARMIEGGADPLKINCAVYGGTGGLDCNLLHK